ncbi:hypothetical protein [Actinomadura madurae]|uniref:hypothetical protein n=1 Tax=Actinomadura madurae TaxID=1993 RepID=UPI0020D25B6E|nr:hypothetical protein [Actinomadura madurae]MCP9968492.1 hypothetical protein [Actinomadura madurae]MCQ0017160.1 hypothetical protein [Actinomadura madurae]
MDGELLLPPDVHTLADERAEQGLVGALGVRDDPVRALLRPLRLGQVGEQPPSASMAEPSRTASSFVSPIAA